MNMQQETKSPVKLKMAKSKAVILSYFENFFGEFHRISEFRNAYHSSLDNKYIYEATTFRAFENFLYENNIYKEKVVLEFPTKTYTRYFIKEPGFYEILQGINKKAYLSHYSAVAFHNLTNNIPKTVFVNVEKSKPVKEVAKKEISQEELNKAFYMPSRISKNLIIRGIYSINLLHGKYTNNSNVYAW